MDERCIPFDRRRSNAWIAQRTLLKHAPSPASHIHTMHSDLPAALAAIQYESELRNFFGAHPLVFDLILLGSFRTCRYCMKETTGWRMYPWQNRVCISVTWTAPLINQAHEVVFLVSGAEKAPVLQEVLEGLYQPHELPAQLIHLGGARPIWLVDKAAVHKPVAETVEPT